MGKALPDAKVTGYETLVPALVLPDPDDRHVLADAIRAGAQMIVTSNLKDFPAECLSPFAIEAKGPDDFLVDQYHLDPVVMNMQVAMITADWAAKRPDSTPGDVYEHLEAAGIIQLAALLRAAVHGMYRVTDQGGDRSAGVDHLAQYEFDGGDVGAR